MGGCWTAVQSTGSEVKQGTPRFQLQACFGRQPESKSSTFPQAVHPPLSAPPCPPGATVCPVAIKYNKIFVDAFWNSKRQSFTAHLVRRQAGWAWALAQ